MAGLELDDAEEPWVPALFVGQHVSARCGPITSHLLDHAINCNYDLVSTNITTPAFKERVMRILMSNIQTQQDDATAPQIPPLCDSDTHLEPDANNSSIIGFTSSWLDLCSADPVHADIFAQVLRLEVSYAAFCGISSIYITGPWLEENHLGDGGMSQYARAVRSALSQSSNINISILLPLALGPDTYRLPTSTNPDETHYTNQEQPMSTTQNAFRQWDAWNLVRTVCDYSSKLSVALVITHHLPPNFVMSRWLSEPLKALVLRPEAFLANRAGYPALRRPIQNLLGRLMRCRVIPWVILSDCGDLPALDDPNARIEVPSGHLDAEAIALPTPAEAAKLETSHKSNSTKHDGLAHLRYVRWLQKHQPPQEESERYCVNYQDYLQIPLQPLADNLESVTYEVFEKDPVKYDLYEHALRKAFRDWADERKATSGPNGAIVVAVVGAGRGPLVTRALQASRAENVLIDLWAVEKNENAFVLLQKHNRREWNGQVTLVSADMRSWQGPTWTNNPSHPRPSNRSSDSSLVSAGQIDILISELLGSFGDNELSPECLDGILPKLSPHGISIPQSYTAYLTPIAIPKLHADIAARSAWDPSAAETPAVVLLHSFDYLSTTATPGTANPGHDPGHATNSDPTEEHPEPIYPVIQEAWKFEHRPGTATTASNRHNCRRGHVTFPIRHHGICHGLAGYFESVLYPGVELSTNPLTMENKSKNMISWFPIFFPVNTPLYLPDSATLTASIWRQTDDRKVWYEWLLETAGDVLRPNGRLSHEPLGSSGLLSSVKSACLM